MWCYAKLVSQDAIDELRYYYRSLQYPVCVLPNGQVVILQNSQLSGQPSTTTDNSLVSSFLMDLAYSVLCYLEDGDDCPDSCEFWRMTTWPFGSTHTGYWRDR